VVYAGGLKGNLEAVKGNLQAGKANSKRTRLRSDWVKHKVKLMNDVKIID
jgi:hypothetical protein